MLLSAYAMPALFAEAAVPADALSALRYARGFSPLFVYDYAETSLDVV